MSTFINTEPQPAKPARKRTGVAASIRRPAVLGRTWTAYLYILPVFVFLGVFTYYAMAFNMQISLFKWNGISANKEFVGFENYVRLFKNPFFQLALKNTAKYFLITIPVQAVIGFTIARLLQRDLLVGRIARTIIFFPNILSLVVIGYVFSQMYNLQNGFLNEMLRAAGLDMLVHDWTGDPKVALNSIIAVNIYTYVGFSMTLYISGLLNIGQEIREAALIDGATGWKTVRYIDFPLLISTHVTITILGIVGTLKTFDIVWLITKGGPSRQTEMMATLLYRSYILEYKAGDAAAIAVVILLIALVLSVCNLIIQRKNAN